MKTTGKAVINAIVRRLNDKDIRCDDTAIVTELRELNRHELNQLITFGDVAKWVHERNTEKTN